MLAISARTLCNTKNLSVFEISLECPECGYSIRFIYSAPERCENCSCKLPNIVNILSDESGRLMYHKKGYTEQRLRNASGLMDKLRGAP